MPVTMSESMPKRCVRSTESRLPARGVIFARDLNELYSCGNPIQSLQPEADQSRLIEHSIQRPVLSELPLAWIAALRGQVIRATQVAVLPRNLQPEPAAQNSFQHRGGGCCDVIEARARIWSNFQVHSDGFGHLLKKDRGLASGGETARLVQRLQELGNYRNMAILGLPVAQSLVSELPLWKLLWLH